MFDKKEKILVEVVKSSENSWYKNKVGQVVGVSEFTEYFYKYDENKAIFKEHCKVVDEDSLQQAGVGGYAE